MSSRTFIAGLIALLGSHLISGCSSSSTPYIFDLPAHFPEPSVPETSPLTVEKIELGRHLFYDTRFSSTGKTSCATCHQQSLAFTDGKAVAEGDTGEFHPKGTMSLTNVAYNSRLMWAQPLLDDLAQQSLLPMLNEDPVEMGVTESLMDSILAELDNDPVYQDLFAQAFPEEGEPVSTPSISEAIASFERTLISAQAPFDRYLDGEVGALTPSAIRGMNLFFSEGFECFHCHGGFNFTDSSAHSGAPIAEFAFHNTGLYNIDGAGAYPSPNTGIHDITGKDEDMGRYRAPTLRNIALTAPYMHDGSIATLSEVLDHYAAGGRTIEEGPHAGDGSKNPFKSEFISGFVLTEPEREDMLAFLESLTDQAFIQNPAFSDPFAQESDQPPP